MPSVPKQSDRRHYLRVRVDFPAILTFGETRFHCRALDLSEFGVLVGPAHPHLVGQVVGVKFIFEPPRPALFLSGFVAFLSSEGLGIRFRNVSTDQACSLRSYVQACGLGVLKGWPGKTRQTETGAQ